jgi:hypothetical protein
MFWNDFYHFSFKKEGSLFDLIFQTFKLIGKQQVTHKHNEWLMLQYIAVRKYYLFHFQIVSVNGENGN